MSSRVIFTTFNPATDEQTTMSQLDNRPNYLYIIGIDEYEDQSNYRKLNNSVFDCQNIIKLLTEKYNFELILPELYNEHATRSNIIETLGQLSFLINSEDNLIIYFAGHGVMNPRTKKGYWVPHDAARSESSYIPNSTIKDKLEDINAKHIFLISDSCFSGTFLTQTRDSSFASLHYGQVDNLNSRWYLASGREETVSDGKNADGSPFSRTLLQVLRENTSKYLSVSEIISSVLKLMATSTKQLPIGGTISNIGHEFGELVLINSRIKPAISKETFNLLMKTFGFYHGQNFTLNKIKEEIPELKAKATLTQMSWNLIFDSSIKHIIEILQKIASTDWQMYLDNLNKHFK